LAQRLLKTTEGGKLAQILTEQLSWMGFANNQVINV
jgi:hypothetical protein